MKRRQFSTYLAASAFAPSAVRAQEAGRTYRITTFSSAERNPASDVVLDGLRSMGFSEGKNLVFDRAGVGLAEEQLVDAVKKVIAAGTDLLMAAGNFIKPAMAATRSVPIVGFADDMVGEGHVASLARPGGNVTGISLLATELDGKRQEFLIEALPRARRMAVLADLGPKVAAHYENLRAAARSSTVELSLLRAGSPQQIEATLKQARGHGDEAVNVLASPVLFAHRQALFATLRALRFPAMYQWPEGVSDGALLAYGPGYADAFRLWGLMAGKILRGAKPSDLPIEQPTAFKLAVNLKTARELGITLPSRLVERADQVVE
jgi:putative ABC transport system substrate-binding protein